MAWQISGKSIETCSCKMLCPCWLGPEGEPDQGWCAGVLGFDIENGSSDGVDLSGTRVALGVTWPGNFFAGNGTARVYLDKAASEDQRRELEAMFSGKKGGGLEAVLGGVISKWLPEETTDIVIEWGDKPSMTVGDIGTAHTTPLKDPNGKPTMIDGAMAQTAFGFNAMNIASGEGTRWSDPGLQEFRGDSATLSSFSWSA